MSKLTKHEGTAPVRHRGETTGDEPTTIMPTVDIYESSDELLVMADMPGVRTDGLTIQLDQGRLTLEGTVEYERPGTVLDEEYRPANYERSFEVYSGIDPGKVSAELKDGVLTVHLPKSDKLKPRQIKVKSG
jgi:HSP20 family molecular chaperone IbpA